MLSKPIDLAGAAAFVVLMAALPLVFPSNYLIGVLTVSVMYGIWAVTWDFMSGLTGRENFGHALFIGVGAYTAGFMNTTFGFNGWWSLPASMVMSERFNSHARTLKTEFKLQRRRSRKWTRLSPAIQSTSRNPRFPW